MSARRSDARWSPTGAGLRETIARPRRRLAGSTAAGTPHDPRASGARDEPDGAEETTLTNATGDTGHVAVLGEK